MKTWPWKAKLVTAALAALCIWLISDRPKDVWMGTIYEDAGELGNEVRWHHAGLFDELSACRTAAQRIMKEGGWPNPDYECALNCRSAYGHGLAVCEETLK